MDETSPRGVSTWALALTLSLQFTPAPPNHLFLFYSQKTSYSYPPVAFHFAVPCDYYIAVSWYLGAARASLQIINHIKFPWSKLSNGSHHKWIEIQTPSHSHKSHTIGLSYPPTSTQAISLLSSTLQPVASFCFPISPSSCLPPWLLSGCLPGTRPSLRSLRG